MSPGDRLIRPFSMFCAVDPSSLPHCPSFSGSFYCSPHRFTFPLWKSLKAFSSLSQALFLCSLSSHLTHFSWEIPSPAATARMAVYTQGYLSSLCRSHQSPVSLAALWAHPPPPSKDITKPGELETGPINSCKPLFLHVPSSSANRTSSEPESSLTSRLSVSLTSSHRFLWFLSPVSILSPHLPPFCPALLRYKHCGSVHRDRDPHLMIYCEMNCSRS